MKLARGERALFIAPNHAMMPAEQETYAGEDQEQCKSETEYRDLHLEEHIEKNRRSAEHEKQRDEDRQAHGSHLLALPWSKSQASPSWPVFLRRRYELETSR